MNEDVISPDLQHFCKGLQLAEVISSLHGCSPIPTHQCRHKAIDGIFVFWVVLLEMLKAEFFLWAWPQVAITGQYGF